MIIAANKSNRIPLFLTLRGCIQASEDRFEQMSQFTSCLYSKNPLDAETLQAHNLIDPDNIDEKIFKQNFYRVTPRYIKKSVVKHGWHDTDCWTTVNTFKKDTHGRYSSLVEAINGFFIDVDFHDLSDADIRDAVDKAKIKIFNAILCEKIPTPTMICRSGRGYHLYFLYDHPILTDDKVRSRLHDRMYSLIIDRFEDIFDDLDIDRKITDRARVCRLPGTLNTKIGELCTLIYYNGPYYDQDTLIKLFSLPTSYAEAAAEIEDIKKKIKEKEERKQAKLAKKAQAGSSSCTTRTSNKQQTVTPMAEIIPFKKALMILKGYENMVTNVFRLTEFREGNMTGNRHYGVHLVYTLSIGAGHDEEYAELQAYNLNSLFTEPLSENELRGCLNHTSRDIFGKPYYGYKKKTAFDRLGLTDEENRALKIDRERLAESNQKIAEERNKKICELRAAGYKYKDIAKETGVPERTVKDIAARYQMRKKDQNTVVDMSLYRRYARAEKVQTFQYKKKMRENEADGMAILPLVYPENVDNSLYGDITGKSGVVSAPAFTFSDDRDVRQQIILSLLNKENVLIQGSGGTGKTYLVKKFIESLSEEEQGRVAFVAPTGVASHNLDNNKGRTLHSLLGINERCGSVLRSDLLLDVGIRNLRNCDRIVIDEISMCRVDLFYVFMQMVNYVRTMYQHPVQIIAVGDFGQLQPTVKSSELPLLREWYLGFQYGYAFESVAWTNAAFKTFVLTKPQRFTDPVFGSICYRLEHGIDLQMSVGYLNSLDHREDESAVYLCGTNATVNTVNNRFAARIPDAEKKSYFCRDKHTGACGYLGLAVGMPVIATENNKHGLTNGKRGVITKLYMDGVQVLFDGDVEPVHVKEKRTGLPLTYGYAMTVHKSQGCTYDKVNIVIDKVFSPAQIYVAVSRCRSAKGIHMLGRPLTVNDVKVSPALQIFDNRKVQTA